MNKEQTQNLLSKIQAKLHKLGKRGKHKERQPLAQQHVITPADNYSANKPPSIRSSIRGQLTGDVFNQTSHRQKSTKSSKGSTYFKLEDFKDQRFDARSIDSNRSRLSSTQPPSILATTHHPVTHVGQNIARRQLLHQNPGLKSSSSIDRFLQPNRHPSNNSILRIDQSVPEQSFSAKKVSIYQEIKNQLNSSRSASKQSAFKIASPKPETRSIYKGESPRLAGSGSSGSGTNLNQQKRLLKQQNYRLRAKLSSLKMQIDMEVRKQLSGVSQATRWLQLEVVGLEGEVGELRRRRYSTRVSSSPGSPNSRKISRQEYMQRLDKLANDAKTLGRSAF